MFFVKKGLLVLRQSFDWSSVRSIDELLPEAFDSKVLHPVGTTRRSIELWNSTFKKSFFEIRHELKRISIENFYRARSTRFDCIGRRKSISRSRITLLTDDDDWVCRYWVNMLPVPNSKLLFCRWQSVRFNGEFFIRPRSRVYSFTNNYCIYPLASSAYSFSDIYQHFDQTKIHDLLSHPEVDYVESPLTVTHKHPASANTLRQLLFDSDWDPDVLKNSVASYIDKCRVVEIPAGLEWTKPLIEQSCSVFESLMS
mgnify:CR=1 FL=1